MMIFFFCGPYMIVYEISRLVTEIFTLFPKICWFNHSDVLGLIITNFQQLLPFLKEKWFGFIKTIGSYFPPVATRTTIIADTLSKIMKFHFCPFLK